MDLDDLLLEIDKNLHNADIIDLVYGKQVDSMLEYTKNNDIKKELANAFSLSYKNIFEDDFSGYKLVLDKHYYEQKYGFRTLVINIRLPLPQWLKIVKKTGLPDWSSGGYFPGSTFSDYKHDILNLSKTGLVIESDLSSKVISEHEALHCDFRKYSVNFLQTFQKCSSQENIKKVFEASLFDEMIALLFTQHEHHYKKYLLVDYFPYLFDYFMDCKPKDEYLKLKDKYFTRSYLAMNMLCWLKDKLEPKILAPLLFSLVPAMNEDGSKYIFERVVELAKFCEDGKNLKPIEHVLRSKNFCKSL